MRAIAFPAFVAVGMVATSALACSGMTPCYPPGFTRSSPVPAPPPLRQNYLQPSYHLPQAHLPPTPHFRSPSLVQPNVAPALHPLPPLRLNGY